MHDAASQGEVGAIKVLTKVGADIHITNKVSWSSLCHALLLCT